jgi:thiol:disulfide interchange protein DsbD
MNQFSYFLQLVFSKKTNKYAHEKAFACSSSFLSANIGFTQTEVKLNWQINYVKTSANNYTITAKTTIPEGWHLYGNNPTVEGLTTIQFNTADFENDSIVGEPTFKETAIVFKDPLFNDLPVNVYENAITVTQQVIIKDPIPAQLHGTIEVFRQGRRIY